ncbi:MAG: DUF5606 domain-containing protein [Bacteroidaceae bacterium]|nr:DUF5606 domain-containing protein [Bacteroidaceae bacterium]
MLKMILAISGKPGLYKLVSRGNKMLIVESLDATKKRQPAYAADKIVSLGDISIYTDDDKEVSLASVLQSVKDNYEGKVVDINAKKANSAEIIAFFEKVLPNYDRDRVRVSDMRKLLSWYNILIESGEDDFSEEKMEGEETQPEAESAE